MFIDQSGNKVITESKTSKNKSVAKSNGKKMHFSKPRQNNVYTILITKQKKKKNKYI